jgi:Bax protein
MLFGVGLLLLGVAVQETLRPRTDYGALLEAWIPVSPDAPLPAIPREPLDVRSAADLRAAFASRAYDLAALDDAMAPVPPLALARLPGDLGALPDPGERKRLFVQSMLPLVLMANRAVRRVRGQVEALATRLAEGADPSARERRWLNELALLYRSRPGDLGGLLERLDVVPVSIALAQAALETGWGTSRFAREGNALYGARTWREDLDGMVPLERPDGASFKVRSYGEPAVAVWSYLHNLNSAPAYEDWRKARAALRKAGKPLTAEGLLAGLERYSEQGADYLALLARLIEDEALHRYADAQLGLPGPDNLEAAAGPVAKAHAATEP